MKKDGTKSAVKQTVPFAWGKVDLADSSEHSFSIGPLRIQLKTVNKEVWIAYEHIEDKFVDEKVETSWSRWGVKSSSNSIVLLPTLPNRALVVKPEYPFRLSYGAEAKVYVRVPVWVSISLADKKEVALTEVPSIVLSNTWFGDFMGGELCYWLSSTARREVNYDDFPPHLAICPISIKNASDEELLVEKIRLQVDLLNLYRDTRSIWSSETRIAFRGSSEVSDVKVLSGAPSEAKDAALIARHRNADKERPNGRTFGRFFDFATLGIFSD